MKKQDLLEKWEERRRRNIYVLESENTPDSMKKDATKDLRLINEFVQDLEKII